MKKSLLNTHGQMRIQPPQTMKTENVFMVNLHARSLATPDHGNHVSISTVKKLNPLMTLLFCSLLSIVLNVGIASHTAAAADASDTSISSSKTNPSLDLAETKTQRIIGGEEASSNTWPWMAAIVEGNSNYRDLNCGAVLIDTRWVLTAAHCVTEPPFEVLMGVTDLYQTGTRIGVKNVYIHSGYFNSQGTLMPDIALIELSSDAPYQPISLYSGSESASLSGEIATVIGWGSLDAYGRRYPNDLMQAEVPIVSYEVCNEVYNGIITEYELCAGYEAGGVDSCTGDSGGPLMVYQDNEWKLVGITAWGEGCAEPGFYGVYTKISEVSDWIQWQKGKPFQKTTPSDTEKACATFDGMSKKLHVPCVNVYDTEYWFDFLLEADHFKIDNFGAL